MRASIIALPLASLCACSFDPLTLGETGETSSSGPTDTDTNTDTSESGTSETEGGEACELELELATGLPPITGTRHAWGPLVMFGRGDELVLLDDGVPEVHAVELGDQVWASSTAQIFSTTYDYAEQLGHVTLWDGQSNTIVADGQAVVPSVTASGDVWIALHACELCSGTVLHWNGAAFEASPPPPLGRIVGLVARDEDDTRWAIDSDMQLASQTADAAWVTHEMITDLGPFTNPRALLDDGDGGLWLFSADLSETAYASHRDPQGVWTHVQFEPLGTAYAMQVVAASNRLYLFDPVDHSLGGWDGSGELGLIAELPDVAYVFGDGERVLGLDLARGQAIVEIDTSPQSNHQTLWQADGVPRSATRSSTSVSAVYELDRSSLRRWNQGWSYLAHSGATLAGDGYTSVWAESDTVAWISEVDSSASPRTRLWRWQDEQLVALADALAPDVEIYGLWGRDGTRVFAWGRADIDPGIWTYNGQIWSALPMPAAEFWPGMMTGDSQRLIVYGSQGRGFAWDGLAWTALPELPHHEWLHELELVAAADLVFAAMRYGDIGFTDELWVLDGDGWLRADARWEQAPPQHVTSISADANGGLWALANSLGDVELWHFDGVAWTEITPTEFDPVDGDLSGAPEGVVIHGERVTQQFRWSCD